MDDLTYEVLASLAAGHSVFRPREATQEAEEAFREVVTLLGRLRERELVDYLEGHITRTEAGIYLAVGPVRLTPLGRPRWSVTNALGLARRRMACFHGAPKLAECRGSLVAVEEAQWKSPSMINARRGSALSSLRSTHT